MPQDRLDEIFKQRLGEVEFAPSSGLWEKIQGEIPPPTPFYQKSSFLAGCLVALLLTIGSATYFFNNYDIEIVAESTLSEEALLASASNDSSHSAYESFTCKAKRNYGTFVAKSLKVVEDVKESVTTSLSAARVATAKVRSKRSGRNAKSIAALASKKAGSSIVSSRNVKASASSGVPLSSNVVAEYSYEQNENETSLFALSTPAALTAYGFAALNESARLMDTFHPGFESLKNKRRGLHIGGFFGYNNTWIVSQNFGLKDYSSNKVNYEFDFGANYGVAIGYDFNDRWGIQTEWVINSAYRQNYRYYWEGSSHIADIKLNYFQFPLLVKYRVVKDNSSMSYLLGVRAARLKSAGLEVNTPSVRVVDVLNTNELGAIVGLEYAAHLNRNYTFTLGARGSLGRAYNSWSDLSTPGKPFNIAVGFRAGLQYNFVR